MLVTMNGMRFFYFLSIVCFGVVSASSCSRTQAPPASHDASKVSGSLESPPKSTKKEAEAEPCKLQSKLVTTEAFPQHRVQIPEYFLAAHEAAKKQRKGQGYEDGQNWTYELALPTCDPKHPTATLSYAVAHRFGTYFGDAKSLVDKRINGALDEGNCFSRSFIYTPDEMVTVSVAPRRERKRELNAERTKCVYQSSFERKVDGVTFRDITVLNLHYYQDCKECAPGVSGSVLQLGVSEDDWPYLEGLVNQIVDSYTIDWAHYAKMRTKDLVGRK